MRSMTFADFFRLFKPWTTDKRIIKRKTNLDDLRVTDDVTGQVETKMFCF